MSVRFTTVRDFQPTRPPARAATTPLSMDHQTHDDTHSERGHDALGSDVVRTSTGSHHGDGKSRPKKRKTSLNSLSSHHRPLKRSSTIKTYRASSRLNWQPGAEPGIDTTQENVAEERLHTECEITVVDFSDEHMQPYELNNATLKEFIDRPKDDCVACRWICVNGLSYDVIKILSNYKSLHRLAVEDLMNTRIRTKADWYPDHCYIVLPLAKLIRLQDDDEHSNCEDEEHYMKEPARKKSILQRLGLAQRNSTTRTSTSLEFEREKTSNYTTHHDASSHIRTLQRYHGGPDQDRLDYMESKATLTPRNMAVSVEQVSIFLTGDNTVISFFEHSAPDIIQPISARLSSSETILRRSGDGSMLTQALIDAIIDLAMPVSAAYDDAIASLELEVLLDPKIKQPKKLYILISEITLLRNLIQPIAGLVNALRDHRAEPISTPGLSGRPRKLGLSSSITITPLTHTYLGDVQDHIVTLSAGLDTMRASAENLTSLIFNMMGAYQNESLK